MLSHITENIETIASLEQASDADHNALREKYSEIPNDYLSFLRQVGFGNLGDIQLYEEPVSPSIIYGENPAESLDNLIIFGDDFQGYCFAFDCNESYRVVEVSPTGEVDRTVEDSFTKLLEGYFS